MYAVGVDSGTRGTRVLIVEFDSGRVLGRGSSLHDAVKRAGPRRKRTGAGDLDTGIRTGVAKSPPWCQNRPGEDRRARSLGPAARFCSFGQRWPAHPAGQAVERHIHACGNGDHRPDSWAGRKRFIEKLGIGLAVGYTASKILWLKNRARTFRAVRDRAPPPQLSQFLATGIRHMEYGDASGPDSWTSGGRNGTRKRMAAVDPGLKSHASAAPPSAGSRSAMSEELSPRNSG